MIPSERLLVNGGDSDPSDFLRPACAFQGKLIGISSRDALEFKARGRGSKLNFSDCVQPVAFRRFQLCKRILQACHTRRQPRLATRGSTRRSTLFWPPSETCLEDPL